MKEIEVIRYADDKPYCVQKLKEGFKNSFYGAVEASQKISNATNQIDKNIN